MAIPRIYFRGLARLALESPSTFHNASRQVKVALSTLCIFRRLTLSSVSSSRNFSTTPFTLGPKGSRWVKRQAIDFASREAKVLQYKSRAAFKLLEIDQDYKIFRPGMTVVDLGFAPGSWSQVAVAQTHPNGRVIGIDLLPAQPPKGVSSIQGDFLSPGIQASIRRYLSDPNRGRARLSQFFSEKPKIPYLQQYLQAATATEQAEVKIETPILELDDTASSGYIAQERRDSLHDEEEEAQAAAAAANPSKVKDRSKMTQEEKEMNTVDVVLSDMWEPWPLTSGFHMNTVLTPWMFSKRLMNTSGVAVRDHAGSMDLCTAALTFCIDVLKPGGSFVCKFYQGEDDGKLERMLEKVFYKVSRVKPDASRPDSKECYFVASKKRPGVTRDVIKVPELNA
ncbi:2' O-ribose methyltransferase [Arthrobotrys conoides]|uniref:rRNA methyltransferase 2, mitochondrial n=1 Tax=Arthrobotrys conoides TaxID=74498 RepID=A0AAN8RXY1_9PEZI